MSGPLSGCRIVELNGLGPGPLAGMILADLGAEVIVVHRTSDVGDGDEAPPPSGDPMGRGKRSIAVDLKNPDGVAAARKLIASSDALIDPFRPGVTERLGLGPDELLADNPKLVYARMTGWGQDGPLADRSGHDITYIAMSGVLAHIGLADQRPTPPLNLVGDFGGGTMFLVVGILGGLFHALRTGEGQVVDTAMVDGSALLLAPLYAAYGSGVWTDDRGSNMLDSGAPWYDTYECADGKHVAVGAIEPQFYAILLDTLGIDPASLGHQHDRSRWPEMRARFADTFAGKARDEWAEIFLPTDACVAPILTMGEAPHHPLAVERSSFVDVGGRPSPAPAPRFSHTHLEVARPSAHPGDSTRAVLAEAGLTPDEVANLLASGAISTPTWAAN
jgi:alpha-methylacyl-CoA racemase